MTLIKEILSYLLGFIALATFAAIAFGSGAPTEAIWRKAFLIGGGLAAAELAVLFYLPKPANRLIIAANVYLMCGGLAFALKQWWFLRGYEQFGLTGILLCMLFVGVVSTFVSRAGFVGVAGKPDAVRHASYGLLGLVVLGIAMAQTFPGIHKGVGAAIITGLALSHRALRIWVRRQ